VKEVFILKEKRGRKTGTDRQREKEDRQREFISEEKCRKRSRRKMVGTRKK
jgi:hypothetical protein